MFGWILLIVSSLSAFSEDVPLIFLCLGQVGKGW